MKQSSRTLGNQFTALHIDIRDPYPQYTLTPWNRFRQTAIAPYRSYL